MRDLNRLVVTAIVLASACPITHAQTLRYQHKDGDKFHYVLQQETTTTTSVKGESSESKLTVVWDLGWNVLKVDSAGTAQLQIRIERARIFVEGPAGKAAADSADKNEPQDNLRRSLTTSAKIMAALDLRGTILATGEMKDVKLTPEAIKTIKELNGGAGNADELLNSDMCKSMLFAPVLASGSIAKGKTWTSKNEIHFAAYKAMIENTYTFEGQDEKAKENEKDKGKDKDKVKLDRIAVKPTMKLEPVAKAPVKVQLKDHKGSGHVLFDNKAGRVVESVVNQRSEMSLEAMGATVNQTIEQRTVVQFKDK